MMRWVVYKNLAWQLFFFTITAVHGSLKSLKEQGKREPANSPNTSLRASVTWYFMITKVIKITSTNLKLSISGVGIPSNF